MMRRIVMVCTGNTCRSPMAEVMLKAMLPGAQVSSAGVAAVDGMPASSGAMQEMARRGLSLAGHRSHMLSAADTEGSLLLCMTHGHLRMVKYAFPDAQVDTLLHFAGLAGDVADPYGGGAEEYREAADMIAAALVRIINEEKL